MCPLMQLKKHVTGLPACRTTVPGADATSHELPTSIPSDRLFSPILRCVAAIGSQPLCDADLCTIRVLVERMAIFASYQGCIPGGLAQIEARETAQKLAWDDLMHSYDQPSRPHSVLDADQLRARGICATSPQILAREPGQRSSADSPPDDAVVAEHRMQHVCGVFSAAI